MAGSVATVAAVVGAAAAVAGTAMTAFRQVGQANDNSSLMAYNQQVAENNRRQAEAAAADDAATIRAKGQRTNATLAAEAAAAGLIPNEGSPYDVLIGNSGQTELEAQRRLYQGKLQGQGYTSQAQLYGAQTNPAGGYLAAGATVFGGVSKAASILGGSSTKTTPINGSQASIDISGGLV